MYGEEHKSKGLDLEEIEYEDISEAYETEEFSEEPDNEGWEETVSVDLEASDEAEYEDFMELADDDDADEDFMELLGDDDADETEYEDTEDTDKAEYADFEDDKASSAVHIIFITLTALGALAVLVVFGVWFYQETDKGEPVVALIHQYVVSENEGIGQNVMEADKKLQEEKRAAEEAARLEAEAAAAAAKEAQKELGMVFSPVEETVTAKEATNLRDMPSQGDESTVVLTLQNGQTATRIGISEQGWSKLQYDGQIYYAVSNYLTTDLTVKPQEVVPEDDGIKTVFTACNDMVTPKIEVNLRALPSVTNPDATVVVTIQAGEVVQRTGINTDVGWSRVVYNGQTLYCVSSYVYVVE
ncbi:MAG: hypothetical protein IJ397_05900 [Lachnospiraceae bacterium]|nr:hypothetical protein [Lachnospiraceae bacterium]